MKRTIFWIDLMVCSIWALAISGSRLLLGSYLVAALLLVVVAMRLTFSFLLTRNEKRAWLPLLITLTGWTFLANIDQDYGIQEMMHYPFYIFNVEFDNVIGSLIGLFAWLWLFFLPIVAYVVLLFRKRLVRTGATWRDVCGGILCNDSKARTYIAIMVIAVAALFTGLGMGMRISLLMCIVSPVLTYWLLCRHYHVECRRTWAIVLGMLVFFAAGQTAGLIRIALLIVSFASIVYVSVLLYKATRSRALAICATLYLGILLPSLSVGYNQYVCLNYARKGFYPALPYNGVFYITDETGEQYGLRDRYKIILEPRYDDIESARIDGKYIPYMFDVLQNGHIRHYDTITESFSQNDDD